MGNDEEDVDDVELVRNRQRKRMNMFIAVVTMMVVLIACTSTYLYSELANTPVEFREELSPWDYPFYEAEERETLEAANEQLAAMELGNVVTVDRHSNHYKARLFRDNNWGIIYWVFKDWDTEIYVNAETGEIFWYSSGSDLEEGPSIPEEDVQAHIEALMVQFAPLPPDLEAPYVHHSHWTSEDILLPNGTWGSKESYGNWIFYYTRTYEGINSTDSIHVTIDVDGTLTYYYKDWFMDLDGFDATFTVTEEEAEDLAREYLANERGRTNVTTQYCLKSICWPWDMDDGPLPGETPVCIWNFEFRDNEGAGRTYWVNIAGTGRGEVISYNICS
jgi:hypothetical protein